MTGSYEVCATPRQSLSDTSGQCLRYAWGFLVGKSLFVVLNHHDHPAVYISRRHTSRHLFQPLSRQSRRPYRLVVVVLVTWGRGRGSRRLGAADIE